MNTDSGSDLNFYSASNRAQVECPLSEILLRLEVFGFKIRRFLVNWNFGTFAQTFLVEHHLIGKLDIQSAPKSETELHVGA